MLARSTRPILAALACFLVLALQVGTLPVGSLTFSDTGITAGLHSYTVAAVDGAGNTGSQSTAASATAINPLGTVPTYDGNGNLTSDGSYGNRSYAYDTLGRLTGVTLAGATTSYALDGAGNRWSQTTAGATTAFDLDLASPNPTVLFDGTAKYLPGAPGLGFESGGVWKNTLTDQLGSPIEYVDTAGVVSGVTHYDPYGAPRPGASAAVGIGYGGEWRDITGSLNLRARSYDPVLGRFIGRDTFAGIASAPQTANRYAYALANPLRYSDPSGRETANRPRRRRLGMAGGRAEPTVANPLIGFSAGSQTIVRIDTPERKPSCPGSCPLAPSAWPSR